MLCRPEVDECVIFACFEVNSELGSCSWTPFVCNTVYCSEIYR